MKMFYKWRGSLILSIFLLNFNICFSQNLVPNSDFEEYFICPTDAGQFNGFVKNWYNPTTYFLSYFNSCADTEVCSVPNNMYGYNYARSGNGYADIGIYSFTFQERLYVSVKLMDTLKSGISYCVGFYINLMNADNSIYPNKGARFATDKISMFFSDTSILVNTSYIIPVIPQVNFINPEFYTDTVNWMLCYAQYTALGGEQYITIGNFDEDSVTNLLQISNSMSWCSGYYIDDAFVYKCSDVAIAEAVEDVHICRGDSVQIGMQTFTDYKYKWLPAAGLSNDTVGNPYAAPQQTTKYYLYLNKYIETVDSITVYVDNCGLQMPNAFTPDGNGKNDIFKPLNSGFKELHGKIFNRWGMKIYEWNDANGGWNGKTEQGNYVSNGVYFYIVSVVFDDGAEETKTGSVEVIR